MSFFVKAALQALRKFPVLNASVDGNDIVYHGFFDIGIAVGSPRGLVVPILRDADQMSFADIELKIAEFGQKAKDGKLSIEELTGGTFSISNGGVFGSMTDLAEARLAEQSAQIGPPLWLLAEVTYRCPLHCVYCFNPVDFAKHENELTTDEWFKVLREARELGSVQCGFSGGEPMLRDDLELIVAEAHRLGYYTNLLTSGIGLNEKRIDALKEAGLDHIQLSFQDSTREMNDFLSSTRTFDLKRRVADLIKSRGYPMVMNCTIHRHNIDHIESILQLASDIDAEYVELANTQYYGWAQVNRDQLLPSREQLERAERITNEWREKHGNRMKLFFVVPDYYENRPKKCMKRWCADPRAALCICHPCCSPPRVRSGWKRNSNLPASKRPSAISTWRRRASST